MSNIDDIVYDMTWDLLHQILDSAVMRLGLENVEFPDDKVKECTFSNVNQFVLSGNYGGNTQYITSIIRYKTATTFEYYSSTAALMASYIAIGY